jgi:hypothetical protein
VHLSEIQLRDPFVLPVAEERTYYVFGTTDPDPWSGPGIGFDCYRSADLAEWHGPFPAFRPPAGFWSPGCYWAPEVHRVGDGWFMFATFTGADGHRGTQVLRAPHPQGPYDAWSDGAVTPLEWQSLDGTLHLDDSGPWLVFCHEWVQCGDGEVCAVRLAEDLRGTVGEVTILFRASDAPWVSGVRVTDGPYLYRPAGGGNGNELRMLWSSMGAAGYAMGVAHSETGSVLGPWRQDPEPIWAADGGHGMVFETFDGETFVAFHSPNDTPHERAVLRSLADIDTT